jgi:formylglycine-generating enzyme required for sulfatase activity
VYIASENLKKLLVCFPLVVALVPISCGKDPVSLVADPLPNLKKPIVMKDIPAGTFTMGASDLLDVGAQPPHQVTLSAFRIQETEVTQEQYLAVMDTNPAYFDTGATTLHKPVEHVTRFDAVKYCNALSILYRLTPVYDTITWTADFTKNGYRLPTEAEWEYACRGGTTTTFWWGADTVGMGARAWTYVDTNGYTTYPVAKKIANPYGLYDMAGNVW